MVELFVCWLQCWLFAAVANTVKAPHSSFNELIRFRQIRVYSFHFTDLGVLVKVLENLPAPLLVLVVLGKPVQVEQTLHRLWSQEVVPVCKLSSQWTQNLVLTLSKSLQNYLLSHCADVPVFLLQNIFPNILRQFWKWSAACLGHYDFTPQAFRQCPHPK